jgi:hypothetical protein
MLYYRLNLASVSRSGMPHKPSIGNGAGGEGIVDTGPPLADEPRGLSLGPHSPDETSPAAVEGGAAPDTTRPGLERSALSDGMIMISSPRWRDALKSRRAVESDLHDMDTLRQTLVELHDVLERERQKSKYVCDHVQLLYRCPLPPHGSILYIDVAGRWRRRSLKPRPCCTSTTSLCAS